MNAYWRAHFARVVRETERLLREKKKDSMRFPSASNSTVAAVVGVAGCDSPNVHTRKES